MKLELKKYEIKTISGEVVKGENVAIQLAEFLSRSFGEKHSTKKLFLWAVKLATDGFIEVDSADWDFLYKHVEENKGGFNVLVHYQVLDALEKEKNKEKSKDSK